MHITISKTRRVLFAPLLAITKWLGKTSPETLVKLRYYARFHKLPNLRTPKDLNEKILYLSLKTDTTQWSRLTDKQEVRSYVEECGLKDILIPEYAVYDSPKEINLLKLPTSFVMKTTHGCGDVIIAKDKNKLNEVELKTYFSDMMQPYGALEGAKHYLSIKPRITVEALLNFDGDVMSKYSSSIIDYKFWCFNGEPYSCFVGTNRTSCTLDIQSYDNNWVAQPEWQKYDSEHLRGGIIPRPQNHARMLEICRILAKGFPCVRVDLYNINGVIYFGEMTFTSYGGMMNYFTQEFLDLAGSKIKLN